ncbi:hypothetical protein KRP22_012647 [Phytophthora ramorum]|nr:hypothetical protein KRP22_12955 [Phytophthora ramorum]
MKTYAGLAASALIVAATMDSAMGMSTYLQELPNGSSFAQALGHPDNDSSQFTKFGTAFGAVSHTWSAEFCKATFPGASMTNGAAFGDPCCTWKKGGTPDFTVTAFTTTPGKATVCASGGGSAAAGGSTAASGASTPSAAGSSAETPSTETQSSGSSATPSTSSGSSAETPSTETQSSGSAPSTETQSSGSAPAMSTGGSSAETPSTGSWGAPPSTGGGCAAKVTRKFRH